MYEQGARHEVRGRQRQAINQRGSSSAGKQCPLFTRSRVFTLMATVSPVSTCWPYLTLAKDPCEDQPARQTQPLPPPAVRLQQGLNMLCAPTSPMVRPT